jgi:hypothetical protein
MSALIQTLAVCGDCNGKGHIQGALCRACLTTGNVTFDIECPECGGDRTVDGDSYCHTCQGKGMTTRVTAEAYLKELEFSSAPLCDGCGDPSLDLRDVDDSDPEVGYFSTLELCEACRRAPKEREAAEYGGLREDALYLLGVTPEWMQEDFAVRPKPMAVETSLRAHKEEAAQ